MIVVTSVESVTRPCRTEVLLRRSAPIEEVVVLGRRLAVLFTLLAVGVAPALLATPAYAGNPTDAWPEAFASNGPIGGIVRVPYKIHVTGDFPVPAGEMFVTYTAPSGTEIPLFPDVPRQFEPPRCEFQIPKTKVRCRDVFHHFPDKETGGEVAKNHFYLKVVKAPVGTGRITLEYPQDTKRSNDSTAFTVKVDGYTPPPSPKRSSAAPRPTRSSPAPVTSIASPPKSSVPATVPNAAPETSAAVSPTAALAPLPVPSIQAVRTVGQSRPMVMTLGFIGGGLLVSFGVGLALWWLRRSRSRPAVGSG
jgi:hypothetical protein